MANYKERLKKVIVANSVAGDFRTASLEWQVKDFFVKEEDDYYECQCGKPHIKYLFSIENILNKKVLFPIGSDCIEKFKNKGMTSDAKVYIGIAKLIEKYEKNEKIKLNKDLFSRDMLKFLYSQQVFRPENESEQELAEKYNYEHYMYLLRLFNAKKEPTSVECESIERIFNDYLYPFLLKRKEVQNQLRKKYKQHNHHIRCEEREEKTTA